LNGPENNDAQQFRGNLAEAYGADGKYPQAEALVSQILEVQRRKQRADDPVALYCFSFAAFLYQRQAQYALAETYGARALAGRRHALGSDHPETMDSAANLALAYQSQGKFTESEFLAREAVEFFKKKQSDDWQRFRAESLLGASLAGQKKYTEAEPLLLAGYNGMLSRKERIDAPDRYYLDRAREWLVQLYEAWGKPEKAGEFAAELN